jgi:hypothetical protein
MVDLFLRIYPWITEAFEDIVEYLGQVLDFIEEFPEMIELFFVSAFGDIEGLISSLNPKEAVEGFGKTLQGFGNDIYGWMKDLIS